MTLSGSTSSNSDEVFPKIDLTESKTCQGQEKPFQGSINMCIFAST